MDGSLITSISESELEVEFFLRFFFDFFSDFWSDKKCISIETRDISKLRFELEKVISNFGSDDTSVWCWCTYSRVGVQD